jgi:hypothetical protein
MPTRSGETLSNAGPWSGRRRRTRPGEARSEARSALRAAHVLSSAALGDVTAVRSTMDVAATADPEPAPDAPLPAGGHTR